MPRRFGESSWNGWQISRWRRRGRSGGPFNMQRMNVEMDGDHTTFASLWSSWPSSDSASSFSLRIFAAPRGSSAGSLPAGWNTDQSNTGRDMTGESCKGIETEQQPSRNQIITRSSSALSNFFCCTASSLFFLAASSSSLCFCRASKARLFKSGGSL